MTSYTAINGQNQNALLNMWEGEHFKGLFNNNSILKFDILSLHHALATNDLDIHTEHKRQTQQDNKWKMGQKQTDNGQTWLQQACSWLDREIGNTLKLLTIYKSMHNRAFT